MLVESPVNPRYAVRMALFTLTRINYKNLYSKAGAN
jgi:hypothetical protein